jgi:heme/copper-type cytochrome/quinol oxidase subunit 1
MFYGLLGVAGLLWATVCSVIMRFELASPGMRIIMSYDSYNVYITLHGLIMIFGFAMPVLFGLYGNVLVPLLICSPEVGFAKLNNASYIVYAAAMILLIEAHLMDILTGLGWTIYPPLSTAGTLLVCYGVTLAFVSLTVMGFSTTFTAANYLATMIIRCSSTRLSVLRNHVYAYMVPGNISYLWCFGLTLLIVFVLRIVTGVCLVTEPMHGVGSILFHMIMSIMGRIAPGLHAIGSTMVMAVLFLHMLR